MWGFKFWDLAGRCSTTWCEDVLLQFSGGWAVRIISASVSSYICAMCLNKDRCRDWIIAVTFGCLVSLLSSSLRTNWCHLSASSVLKHHWSRASILHASTLVTAQHSDPYRKTGRMQVLYNFSLVEIETRLPGMQTWKGKCSRYCPAEEMIRGPIFKKS